ncbi:PREDICTED: esterase E4-like [Trachymyrmex septentrionalis]|uniref:esterase E4-like n=1 Tax=Trachymyrmex septentrionalis TaxID=34720 RepID=UPI00084F4229|nr:PREDICTED: esterase E4-like [Trachymyrmex septentrionalis]
MDRPIVTVKQGKLQGIFEENVLGSRYLSFKGIPFAAPPMHGLRFKDPEPPAHWEGIRDASKNAGDICAQMNEMTGEVIGGEDCLYLNIYVPDDIYRKTGNPVMVWIHGGGYLWGSGNDTNVRPDYLLTKGVILVAISYRLGAFGFLNLGHEVASGNQGLKDQVAALKWIKKNIDVFGGDPNNITVFGVSAGSTSTHLLTLSPLSKGLFQKAILQSGVATCDWATIRNQPEANSFKLASKLGNDSKDPKTIVEFLRTKSFAEIVQAQYTVLTPEMARTLFVPFGPTIDDKAKTPFLPCPLSQLLDGGNNIPIMIGATSDEYIFFLRDISENNLKTMYADLPLFVENFTNSKNSSKIERLTKQVKEKYFNDKSEFTADSIPSIIRFLSDLHFNIPIEDFVDMRRKRKHAPTYFYKFSYIGDQMTLTKVLGNKLTGTSHTDDMSYLFYQPSCKANNPAPPAINTKDRKILEILTTMWTNFAKTGHPTPVLDQYVTTSWTPATVNFFNYLDINDDLQLLTITNYDNTLAKEVE